MSVKLYFLEANDKSGFFWTTALELKRKKIKLKNAKTGKKVPKHKKANFFEEFKQNHFSRTRELPGVALVIFQIN